MSKTGTNTSNEPMMPMTSANSVVGRSSGSVIDQNSCQRLAPSIMPASWIVGGMVCSPAR